MRTPQRQTVDNTIGGGITGPTPSTTALAPNIGVGAAGGTDSLAVIGADVQTTTFSSVTSTSTTNVFTCSGTIPLPNLPAPFTPAYDDMLTISSSGFITGASITSFCLVSQQIVPQAVIANNGLIYGPTLQTGVTILGWSAVVTLFVYSFTGAAPTGIKYQLHAVLYDLPG